MKQTHAVVDGTVFCVAQHRTVDVMACYGCERLITIDIDSRRPKVTCKAPDAGEPIETS
jgi:hypothetical protein